MACFPIFQDIADKNIVIAGGGTVALRKAEKLQPFGPVITVIAPEILPEFDALGVRRVLRQFCDGDIGPDTFLAIAATDDADVNRRVYDLCTERRIPVNVVDNPALCTFLFPSLVQRGKLTVGISTGGASPSGAIWVRQNMEQMLPENFGRILDWLDAERILVKEKLSPESLRAECLKELFAACMAKGGVLTVEERDEVLRKAVARHGK